MSFLKDAKNYSFESSCFAGAIVDYNSLVNIAENGKVVPVNSFTSDFSAKSLALKVGPSFIDVLMTLLNKDGRDNADIYNSVSMDRRVFSKLLQGKSISKRNVVVIAIALKLDLKTTQALLALAGMAFDPSNKTDVIVVYAIEHKIYDPYEIEEALLEWGEPSLFFVE